MTEEIRSEASDLRLQLSIERTELALERTHLAWTRSIIVLISSGFAIDAVAEKFHDSRIESGKALLNQTHIVSLVMVSAGMFLLISECTYYIKRSGELAMMKELKRKSLPNGIILSVIIFCVGLLMIFYMLIAK